MSSDSAHTPALPVASFIAVTVSGFLFGLGLATANMTNPAKVLAFLDVTGTWDPSLMVVFAAALGVTLPGFHMVLKQQQPRYAQQFLLPTSQDIDRKLIGGASLFGIGWGIAGYCPGPALTALVSLNSNVLLFFAAMLAGVMLHKMLEE
ncbi:MAG: DUF6691 family protein [Pseudohongiellaceae bacterium]